MRAGKTPTLEGVGQSVLDDISKYLQFARIAWIFQGYGITICARIC